MTAAALFLGGIAFGVPGDRLAAAAAVAVAYGVFCALAAHRHRRRRRRKTEGLRGAASSIDPNSPRRRRIVHNRQDAGHANLSATNTGGGHCATDC
jgi:hypothetical protein